MKEQQTIGQIATNLKEDERRRFITMTYNNCSFLEIQEIQLDGHVCAIWIRGRWITKTNDGENMITLN